jgi:hypothetical protein
MEIGRKHLGSQKQLIAVSVPEDFTDNFLVSIAFGCVDMVVTFIQGHF